MARGGYRPGAGRPKRDVLEKTSKVPADIRKAAVASNVTPLEYMLLVMNSAEADDGRRDRMAIAAAPYVHERAADKAAGKKEAAQDAARSAGVNSGWGDDLVGKPN